MTVDMTARLAGADVATDDEERFGALEAGARLAIEAVTHTAEQRLAQAMERGETRIVDALSLAEQLQRDLVQWREACQGRLDQQLRELGEWDEELRALKHELGGLHELAEAAIGVASDELERRWEAQRHELADLLQTAASDERARWEAFMHTTTATLTGSGAINPAEVAALRASLAELHTNAAQQAQQLTDWHADMLQQLRDWQAHIDQALHQGHNAAHDEIRSMRSATQLSMQRVQRQSRVWQFLALIIAILALLASGGAVALPLLHLR